MRYTLLLTRGTDPDRLEFDHVTREDSGRILAASWCMGYIRAALSRGWTLVSIDVADVDCIHPGVFAPSEGVLDFQREAGIVSDHPGFERCPSCNTLVPWADL